MYLEAIPTSMKNVLANEVICGGWKRDPTAAACLGSRITPDTRYCKANLPRYTYNKDTGFCEAANYDGCYKTENRFLTKEECDDTCADYKEALLKVLRKFSTKIRFFSKGSEFRFYKQKFRPKILIFDHNFDF